MTTLPMLVGLVAVLATAVYLTAGPASAPSRSRDRRRRNRMLARSPQRVSGSDVEHLLTASLSAFETDLVRRWVAERQIPAALLWQWLTRHGAEALLLCLAAGFDAIDLRHHLDDLSKLDRRSLELQAELRVLDPWLDQLDSPANDDLGSASWD